MVFALNSNRQPTAERRSRRRSPNASRLTDIAKPREASGLRLLQHRFFAKICFKVSLTRCSPVESTARWLRHQIQTCNRRRQVPAAAASRRALCFPLPAKRGEGQGERFVFLPNIILLKSGGINFCSPVFLLSERSRFAVAARSRWQEKIQAPHPAPLLVWRGEGDETYERAACLKFFQFFLHQFNQRPDGCGIKFKLATGGRKQFRQRPRTAQRQGFFVVGQRLHLVAL